MFKCVDFKILFQKMENVRCRVINYYLKLFLKCMFFYSRKFKLLVLTVNSCIVAKYATPPPPSIWEPL